MNVMPFVTDMVFSFIFNTVLYALFFPSSLPVLRNPKPIPEPELFALAEPEP